MSITLFPGGLSKAEFALTNSFPGTEIPGIMKETKIEFKTPTEEDAAGRAGAAGKSVDVNLVSKDLTDAPYATLRGYEAVSTPIFLKLTGINPAQSLVLKNLLPIVELQPAEAGKNWKRIVKGSGFAANEADLLALTLS